MLYQSTIENNNTIMDTELSKLNKSTPLFPINIKDETNSEINFPIENNINNESNINNSILLSPIYINLIEFGYDEQYSKRLISNLNPHNIEEALDYLSIIDNKIQHFYVEDHKKIDSCYICGKNKNEHMNDDYEIQEDDIYLDNNSFILNYNISINNNINNISNFNEPSIDIGEKFICPICNRNLGENKKIIIQNCNHFSCKKCLYNFLKVKIIENKLTFIKCLNYECNEKISDKVIKSIISNNEKLLEKYNNYKLKLEIINDPNKKFCPYPNCNSFLIKNKNEEEKNTKCKNGHEYCFICLNKPHENKLCEEKFDDNNIKEYAKNKFIKKCPNCGTFTEKNEGCNHITCAECNYQWCWLCNQKYTINHFDIGKCKGFQFFQPKNDNDIKLAFEGKIQLNNSERQLDFFNDNLYNIPHRNIDDIYNGNDYHRRYLENLSLITRILYFIMFLFCGQPLIFVFDLLDKYFYRVHFKNQLQTIIGIFYLLTNFMLWISYFFLQMFFNLIIHLFSYLYIGYFNDFNYSIPFILSFIYYCIISIFFGLILHVEHSIYYNYFRISSITEKIIHILYILTMIIFQIIYFFLQCFINIIILIILLFSSKINDISYELRISFNKIIPNGFLIRDPYKEY